MRKVFPILMILDARMGYFAIYFYALKLPFDKKNGKSTFFFDMRKLHFLFFLLDFGGKKLSFGEKPDDCAMFTDFFVSSQRKWHDSLRCQTGTLNYESDIEVDLEHDITSAFFAHVHRFQTTTA